MKKTIIFFSLSLLLSCFATGQEQSFNKLGHDSEDNGKDKEKLTITIFSYLNDFQSARYYDEYNGYTYNPEGIMIYDTLTNPESVWEIAIPNKGDWTEGGGGNWQFPIDLVLFTDSIDSYPINNESVIDFVIDMPEWFVEHNYCWSNFTFRFRYKCETDTLLDGLEVYINFDGSDNLVNAMNQEEVLLLGSAPNSVQGTFCDNPGNNLIYGISGTTSLSGIAEWGLYLFEGFWNGDNAYNATQARIKLVFKSDDIQTNKRGFIIDGLVIRVKDECHIISAEQIISKDIKVFPNPANNQFHVEIDKSTYRTVYIEIYNSLGEVCVRKNLDESNTIKCNNLQSGIYYYKIFSSNQLLKTDKIVINY